MTDWPAGSWIAAGTELCLEKINLFKIISLLAQTVAQSVEGTINQLKTKANGFEWFSLALDEWQLLAVLLGGSLEKSAPEVTEESECMCAEGGEDTLQCFQGIETPVPYNSNLRRYIRMMVVSISVEQSELRWAWAWCYENGD